MAKKSAPSATAAKTKPPARIHKTVKTADKPQPAVTPPPESDVAQIKAFRQQLAERGYESVFDVVRKGRAETISNYLGKKTAKRERAAAQQFFEQAEAHAAALTRLHRQLTARGEPIAQAIAKLGIAYDAEWLDRAIGSSGNYQDWFGRNLLYAHPDSVGSLFSPGSYLTTLYRVAKPLHPATHGLQLDKRRPDLNRLPLSDTHLNQEISTLTLILEVLEQGVVGDAEEQLRTKVFPMILPYNHASEQIRQGLAALKSSQAEIWATLGDNEARAFSSIPFDAWITQVLTPGCVRDRLALSPEEFGILTQGMQNTQATVGRYYGLSRIADMTHVGSEAAITAIQKDRSLLERTQLDQETLMQALGVGAIQRDVGDRTLEYRKPVELRIDHSPDDGGYSLVTIYDMRIDREADQITWVAQVNARHTVTNSYMDDASLFIEMRWGNESVTSDDPMIHWSNGTPAGVTREVRITLDIDSGVLSRSDFVLTFVLGYSPPYRPRPRQYVSNGPISLEWPLIAPQKYGARYIHGWDSDVNPDPPLYAYVGTRAGHPATPPANNPATSRLYNRHGQNLERLNRVIRLQRRVGITFEELDWLIVAAAVNLSDYPLTRPLQALAVYLPLRERYGFSVNAFVACIGSINTYHRPGEQSFFRELFGNDDFLSTRLFLSPPRDDAPSQAARAILCRGLGISADVLIMLARLLPGVIDNGGAIGYVLPTLNITHVDALYRLVAIPRLFGLAPDEALQLWNLLDAPGVIAQSLSQQERPVGAALAALERTGYLVDWMRREGLDAARLIVMTSRDYRQVATPELQGFLQNIYSTLSGQPGDTRSEQALFELLCRHIGAQFGLKPSTSLRLIEWMDAVAARMNPAFTGYSVLTFWNQIQAYYSSPVRGLSTLESDLPQLVQYANLIAQFALLCHWAQLSEQDLALIMPRPSRSLLTGELLPPLPDLPLLLLLSRYRHWQKLLVLPVAEGRRYLQRAAAGEWTAPADIAQELALLHGWDKIQVLGCMESLGVSPRSFRELYPLVARMQLGQKLGQAPTDLSLLDLLAGLIPDQNTLEQFAANILAAAHA